MDSTNGPISNVHREPSHEYSQEPVGEEDDSGGDTPPYRAAYEYPPPDQVRPGPYYIVGPNHSADTAATANSPPVIPPTMGGLAPAALLLPQPAPGQETVTDPRGKYVARGLLPDIIMAQLTILPYNSHWMIINGVDQSVLSSFKSKMKFETMFGHSIFQVGDVFKPVAASGAIVTDNEAIVTGLPTPQSAYPNFRIHNTTTGATSNLQACKGVNELYQAMVLAGAVGRIAFSTFHVYRKAHDLGDLSNLRQALEVYIEESDAYIIRTGGTGRRRRG